MHFANVSQFVNLFLSTRVINLLCKRSHQKIHSFNRTFCLEMTLHAWMIVSTSTPCPFRILQIEKGHFPILSCLVLCIVISYILKTAACIFPQPLGQTKHKLRSASTFYPSSSQPFIGASQFSQFSPLL